MSQNGVAIRNVALALSITCIILASGLIIVSVRYDEKISSIDSQVKALSDQMASINVTNWPAQQPEPPWKVYSYKGFTMSWPQLNWGVHTPEWVLYCGGYSKAIIYMTMTNISDSLQGSITTVYLNYVQWYGSTQGGNDFLGDTELSKNDMNVTVPGPYSPQRGPLEVETKGPYLRFVFSVDSTYNVTASAVFDLSVYLRN